VNREEDLNEDDVERLTSRDVVAIARGRREAALRTVGNQPHAAPAPVARDDAQAMVEVATQLNALLDQLKDEAAKRVARASLLEYLQSDTRRVPVALGLILRRGWLEFAAHDRSEDEASAGWWVRELAALDKRDPNLKLACSDGTNRAALRLVGNWNGLSELDLGRREFKQDDGSWQTFICQIKYIAHLCGEPIDHGHGVLFAAVFSTLWVKMSGLIRGTPWPRKLQAALAVLDLLKEGQKVNMQQWLFIRSKKDSFFTTVEDARDEALEKQEHATAGVLGVGDGTRPCQPYS
jgi:hypothetical protein